MKAAQSPGRFVALLVTALVGPLVWALHLMLVYLVQHVVCYTVELERARAVVWVFVTVTTVIAALILLVPVFRPNFFARFGLNQHLQDHTRSFLLSVMRLLALLSLFAVFWQGAAVLFLAQCSSLR